MTDNKRRAESFVVSFSFLASFVHLLCFNNNHPFNLHRWYPPRDKKKHMFKLILCLSNEKRQKKNTITEQNLLNHSSNGRSVGVQNSAVASPESHSLECTPVKLPGSRETSH